MQKVTSIHHRHPLMPDYFISTVEVSPMKYSVAKLQLLSVTMMPYIGQAILQDVDTCAVWLLNF